jgi:hypothetical protein
MQTDTGLLEMSRYKLKLGLQFCSVYCYILCKFGDMVQDSTYNHLASDVSVRWFLMLTSRWKRRGGPIVGSDW